MPDEVKLAEPDPDSEPWWLLVRPVPLAGMCHPTRIRPDWQTHERDGFSAVLPLHRGGEYDCSPLKRLGLIELKDLAGGGPPSDPGGEWELVRAAVEQVVRNLRSGVGTIVHCNGGKGRTGTVLACVLRELGCSAEGAPEAVEKRGGHLEADWQRDVVAHWPHRPPLSG